MSVVIRVPVHLLTLDVVTEYVASLEAARKSMNLFEAPQPLQPEMIIDSAVQFGLVIDIMMAAEMAIVDSRSQMMFRVYVSLTRLRALFRPTFQSASELIDFARSYISLLSTIGSRKSQVQPTLGPICDSPSQEWPLGTKSSTRCDVNCLSAEPSLVESCNFKGHDSSLASSKSDASSLGTRIVRRQRGAIDLSEQFHPFPAGDPGMEIYVSFDFRIIKIKRPDGQEQTMNTRRRFPQACMTSFLDLFPSCKKCQNTTGGLPLGISRATCFNPCSGSLYQAVERSSGIV